MKYTAAAYARAFVTVAKDVTGDQEEGKLVQAFVGLIEKNRDMYRRKDILRHTERLLAQQYGKRRVLFETARPIQHLRKIFKTFLTNSDIIEEKIAPELVAGVRITVNDEDQFDGTLNRKLRALFS